MPMTLSMYQDNPMGKKNAVFSNREMYKDLYTKKFDMILLREGGKIDYALYTIKDRYCIRLKIPSEVVPHFTYDVLIEFYTDDEAIKVSRNLSNYFVRFYSNDPSFVFTYCKAFIDNDLFIKQLNDKMSKKARTEIANEKNPKEIIGYVKSLYFAILWIKSKGLMDKSLFETYGTKSSYADISKHIEHADSKIEARQKAGEEIAREKAKEREKDKKFKQDLVRKDMKHAVSFANVVNGVKKISSVKKTKTVKRTKKI